jgi:hypothetical protein
LIRLLLVSLLALGTMACSDPEVGMLQLTVLDGVGGEPTPARVEISNAEGESVVAPDALPIFEDCGSMPVHNWLPWTASAQHLRGRHGEISNPYTGTTQFYSPGVTNVELRPGRYALTATKGIEYRVAATEFVIEPERTAEIELELDRWIDLPANGWYGADDHLHIPRPHPRFDSAIAVWMQAEDIHVANLLQMGLARDVHITPQHSFGQEAVYREGNTLLASGQENPRTHVLGHSIILGARHWIDFPSDYVLYDRFWRLAHEQGAINGYAHWGLAGAEEGLAVWGHEGLLDFIEVLNLGFPFYQRWYEALDLGIRLGPTAGSDYPCLPGLPGRERFYTRLEEGLDYRAWLDAVRRGRTFVTNGPVVELEVSGAGIGDEVRLPAPGRVHVNGRVRFDRERDAVETLELIRAGEVVQTARSTTGQDEIRLESTLEIDRSTWLALRASGRKVGETLVEPKELLGSLFTLPRPSNDEVLAGFPEGAVARLSAAHTGAVWVTVAGSPSIAEQPRAREVLEMWLERLDELEDRLRDERLDEMARFPGRGDGISRRDLLASRAALLGAIEAARRQYARPVDKTAPSP